MNNAALGSPTVVTPLRPIANASKHPKVKVLFVGESVSLAHVGRPALLARWALEAGSEVHFACGSRYASIAQEEGLEVYPIKTIQAEVFYERLKQGSFFYTCEELEAYIAEERKLIRNLKPNWVVSDFRLTLPISAQLEGVKCLSLQQAHWSPKRDCLMPPPHIAPFTYLPSILAKYLFAWLRPTVFKQFAQPLNKVRTSLGLNTLNDFRKHYTAGTACAYLDLPALSPVAILPNNHFYLGPLHWTPKKHIPVTPIKVDQLGSCRPLAYVSLGSSGDQRIWLMLLHVLIDLGFDIVASGASTEHQSQWLKENVGWRNRVVLLPMMNPSKILKRAALMICHGGHGTTYQGLLAGIPILSLPANPDQGLMAAALESSGAGRFLCAHHVTRKHLHKLIKMMMIDPSYKIASLRWTQKIQNHNTKGNWIKFINQQVEVP